MDSNQLYNQQQQYNKYINAGAGAASLFGQWEAQQHMNDGININPPGSEVDAYGKPVYNLAGLQQNIDRIDTSQGSFGNVAKSNIMGGLQGAAAGSAFGAPGAALGAIVGSIGGTISSLTAGAAAKKKKRQAQMNLLNAQRSYNAQMAQYNVQQAGQSLYSDLANNDRSYNIYKFNSPYVS